MLFFIISIYILSKEDKMIITEELVQEAIRLVTPTAKEILNGPGTTWGPRWVDGYITASGLDAPIPFTLGNKTAWDPAWGEERNFDRIAWKKLRVAERLGQKTSIVVAVSPWLLLDGEFMYPGGDSRYGISSSASGGKGRADECLASLLIEIVIMLANLEADKRKEAKEMQI